MYLKNQLSARIDWRICGVEPAWHGRNPPPVLLFNRLHAGESAAQSASSRPPFASLVR
jgi:hypothetical protein